MTKSVDKSELIALIMKYRSLPKNEQDIVLAFLEAIKGMKGVSFHDK